MIKSLIKFELPFLFLPFHFSGLLWFPDSSVIIKSDPSGNQHNYNGTKKKPTQKLTVHMRSTMEAESIISGRQRKRVGERSVEIFTEYFHTLGVSSLARTSSFRVCSLKLYTTYL